MAEYNSTSSGYPLTATIDPVNDVWLIWTNSVMAVQSINRNVALGLASGPVGLTDVQTLTNKTLTAPTISSPVLSGTATGTYTLGGTPTFPASVATLTGAQVLTNKTLTSPTINSPSITNATLTTDAVTGYTTSNSGVVYGGLTMTTGNAAFSGNATVGGTLGVTGASTLASLILNGSLTGTGLGSQVQSQANAGTAGGTFYYINLGGIKLMWINGGNQAYGAGGTNFLTFTLPTFFTTLTSVQLSCFSVGNNAYGFLGTQSTSIITGWIVCSGAVNPCGLNLFLIGT